MKPKDLKSPFKKEEGQILIHDQVWYIPDSCSNRTSFSFPGWTHPQMFNQDRPICIEYCSGNGAWIAAKAQSHPECNWVAIEHKFDRVRKIWSKLKNLSLQNLLAVCGEGYQVTQGYIPTSSVQSIFINFPDPWPKRRHAKNRLIQVPFIKEMHRILQPEGILTMVTDDESYSKTIIDLFHQVAGFQSLFPSPYYVTDYPSYGTSYFEDLWRLKGKAIRYHAFRQQQL
jgi:tRNA (guanine-N7-)-methyltransferase